MLLLAVPLVAYVALLISTLLVFVFYRQLKLLRAKFDEIESKKSINNLLMDEQQRNYTQIEKNISQLTAEVNECILENSQVSKQLEHRIKTLQEKLHSQQLTLEQLQNQQPEDKLYSRAYKLAALGAGIEEIIRECEIPRAEAEMLLSVYQKSVR